MRKFDYLDLDKILLEHPNEYLTTEKIIVDYIPSAVLEKNKTIKSNNYAKKIYQAKRKIEDVLMKYGLQFDFKNGKDAKGGFRYPQGVEDPLRFEKEEFHKFRTKQLMRLVQSSVDLFPQSWLADIFEGAQTPVNDDNKLIWFDQNMFLERLHLVPTIFDAIEKKKVISFKYRPGYKSKKVTKVLLHPYFLKENDSRWFVIGYNPDSPEPYLSYGLDRIIDGVIIEENEEYINPDDLKSITDKFKNIVGVTYLKNRKVKRIYIETLNEYTHGRILTKPLHGSQKQEQAWNKKEKHGIFYIDVIPNKELVTLLLSFGSNIKVLDSDGYGKTFRKQVQKLIDMYPPDIETKNDDSANEQNK